MRIWSGASVFGFMFVFLAGSLPAQEAKKVDIEVGATAPIFEATDDQGKPWKSADHVGKKFVVVYFFPADFTPGCRTQAQKFRDNMNALNEQGIEVVGISGDSVVSHGLFKHAEKLNFTLLADVDGQVAKKFGVPLTAGGEVRAKDAAGNVIMLKREVTAARWTFIIGQEGKIIYKNTKVVPTEDSKKVAEFIENLRQK
jgi:thioredoxin-dependent peroxiredoxin